MFKAIPGSLLILRIAWQKELALTYQANDVLFARLRPYLNKVYRAEMNGCCSTEFLVLRIKNTGSVRCQTI